MNISWTRYKTKRDCPLQYCLVYEQRVPMIKPRLPFVLGSIVHDSIKQWAERDFPIGYIDKAAVSHFKSHTAGIKFANKGVYLKLLRRAVAGALIAEQMYRLLEFPQHKAIIEERFRIPIPNFAGDNLIGGADVYDPITFAVYDLKMHIESNVSDREQTLTYAWAESLLGREVKRLGFISPLKASKLATDEVTKAEIDAHGLIIVSELQSMKKGVTANPTPGKHCFICGYRQTTYCSATHRPL